MFEKTQRRYRIENGQEVTLEAGKIQVSKESFGELKWPIFRFAIRQETPESVKEAATCMDPLQVRELIEWLQQQL